MQLEIYNEVQSATAPFAVSVILSFVNNTAISRGAIAFDKQSYDNYL